MSIKSEDRAILLEHTTSDQSDKTFLLAKGCLFLPWGFIYMYEIKQNII